MKLRIVNETGISHDTKVFLGEQEVPGVMDIHIHPFDVKTGLIPADITLLVTSIEFLVDAHIYVMCPHCARRIECEVDALQSGGVKGS